MVSSCSLLVRMSKHTPQMTWWIKVTALIAQPPHWPGLLFQLLRRFSSYLHHSCSYFGGRRNAPSIADGPGAKGGLVRSPYESKVQNTTIDDSQRSFCAKPRPASLSGVSPPPAIFKVAILLSKVWRCYTFAGGGLPQKLTIEPKPLRGRPQALARTPAASAAASPCPPATWATPFPSVTLMTNPLPLGVCHDTPAPTHARRTHPA